MNRDGRVYVMTRGNDRRTHFASLDAALAWASKEGYTEQTDRLLHCLILRNPNTRTYASITQYTLHA